MFALLRFAAHAMDRAIVGAGSESLTPAERVELAEAERIVSAYPPPVFATWNENTISEIETCIEL